MGRVKDALGDRPYAQSSVYRVSELVKAKWDRIASEQGVSPLLKEAIDDIDDLVAICQGKSDDRPVGF